MSNKMLDSLKNNWPATVLSAVSIGSLALSFLYRKNLYQHLWRRKISNIIRGTNKKVSIISTTQQWEKIAPEFMYSETGLNALGFDCEWCFNQKRRPVALLQLATYSGTCVLVQLSHLEEIPASLKDILADDKIIKAGVDPMIDSNYLSKDYKLKVQGCVDLRHFAFASNCEKNVPLGLASLANSDLGMKLDKSKIVKCSNWEATTLSKAQVMYASDDALAGILLLIHYVGKLNGVNFDSILSLFSSSVEPISKAIEKLCCGLIDYKFRFSGRDSSSSGSGSSERSFLSAKPASLSHKRGYSLRKTPLYHNSQLWAPDNEPLCTCDPQKAMWYVDKKLGELISEDPLIVRLNFEPAGRPNKEGNDGQFYLQERENICVVCGKTDSYIRKNIIPHEYRKHFPEILKAHQSHDVVLLCVNCHQQSNILDNSLRYDLASKHNAPIGFDTDIKKHMNGKLKKVKNAAGALVKSRHKMPSERIQHLEKILKDFLNCDSLTESQLYEYANMDVNIYNKDYTPHAYIVYSAFEKTGLIHLEVLWREWFLEKMEPKHLPDKWSVSHNHEKLKIKMSRLPLDHPLREDYKKALVGTEGAIDIPYLPSEIRRKPVENFFGLNNKQTFISSGT